MSDRFQSGSSSQTRCQRDRLEKSRGGTWLPISLAQRAASQRLQRQRWQARLLNPSGQNFEPRRDGFVWVLICLGKKDGQWTAYQMKK